MNNLYDSATGEEFRLGPDGRYYHGGVGYEAVEGDTSPLGSGGTLVSTPPNTGTLPDQGASSASIPMGQSGNEHRILAGKLVQEVAAGRLRPQQVIERLINVTSPLQVVQQGVLDAFMDYYESLDGSDKKSCDPFLEKYDDDPLYTVDVLMGDLINSPTIGEVVQNGARDIVARYNLSVP